MRGRMLGHGTLTLFLVLNWGGGSVGAILIPTSRSVRSGYNEPCDRTQRCRSQSWFSCDPQTGLCQCAKPEEMIYDLQRDKCVSLIGGRCKYGFDEHHEPLVPTSTSSSEEPLTHRWYEKSECVSEGVCEPSSGICICPPGFYEDVNKNRCSAFKDHLDTCQAGFECNSQKLLTCIQGQCQCVLPNDMTFDPNKGSCLIQIGKQCYSNPQSFDNTVPGVEILKFKLLRSAECVEGADCRNLTSICSCPSGQYIDFQNNSCQPVKGHGQPCIADVLNRTEECDSSKTLICVDGFCQCDPEVAVYNEDESYSTILTDRQGHLTRMTLAPGTCVAKVGKICEGRQLIDISTTSNTTHLKPYCVNNAICSAGKCICSEGYTESSDKRCALGYDKPCSMISSCSDRFVCSGGDLAISKGQMRCSCPNPMYQIYDPLFQTCRGIVGAPCKPEDKLSCIKNTECLNYKVTMESQSRFRCECSEGYVETVNGTCDIAYGYPCGYQTQPSVDNLESMSCDHLAGLQCRGSLQKRTSAISNFTCSCPNEEDVYEGSRRRCSTPVGIRCQYRKLGSSPDSCVTNANCEMNFDLEADLNDLWSGLAGRCACAHNFRSADNFQCIIADLPEPSQVEELNEVGGQGAPNI